MSFFFFFFFFFSPPKVFLALFSLKLERATWEPRVELAWNNPSVIFFILKFRGLVIPSKDEINK